MKKPITLSLLIVVAISLMVGSGLATKPGQEVNPNGFPSGPHYNLNIIGKKDGFTCPEQEYVDGKPIYGNVIFIPEDGTGIEIYMQSGKGKKFEAINELRAIDPCAVFDGDGAVIELPKNEAGYRVYARALAKPTASPSIATEPSLVSVQDEHGNDLIYLGSLSANGFETPDGRIYRTKGKPRALNITPLFQWTGLVCYFDVALSGNYSCGKDTNDDGWPDEFTEPVDGSCPEGYLVAKALCGTDTNDDGWPDEFTEPVDGSCPEGYAFYPDSAYCWVYDIPTWVFNIEAFIEYLWSLDNKGLKLLQLRFYPN